MRQYGYSRRQWLTHVGAGGFLTLAGQLGRPLLAARPTGQARHCIVLWMNGGPSQFETFDPKPGMETGGEVGAIGTSAPGLAVSEFLPEIAKHGDKLAVLRCISSPEGEHERAQYMLHTGYPLVPAFPRPALGSVVSHDRGRSDVPHYVTLGAAGYGSAFLGQDHAAFSIDDPKEAHRLLSQLATRTSQLDLLRKLEAPFIATHAEPDVATRRARIDKLRAMMGSRFLTALDLNREPTRVRRRYGEAGFGRSCLLARRLIEAGVAFVEVAHDGWDTHADNHRATRRLCAEIDRPWSQLLADLQSRGLLDETLIVWMGEFGRTPAINGRRGRDHFPRVTPVVLCGAGVKAGQAIGETNQDGTELAGVRYGVPDLFATLLHLTGIPADREFTTAFGSPTRATDDGQVIGELL